MTLEVFKSLSKEQQLKIYAKIKKEEASYKEEFKSRCETDVKIGTNLWVMQLSMLDSLYEDRELVTSTIKYLNFKMEKAHIRELHPLYVDRNKVEENLNILESIIAEKVEELKTIMPKVPKYKVVTKPKTMFRKDGSISVAGERWVSYLIGCNLPNDYEGEIKVKVSEEEPNPNSSSQIKDFLFSLGWEPILFKDGANGKVPQLRDDDKELCKSIKCLFPKYPELEALDGLSVARHRASYLKSFLSGSDEEGRIVASAGGFTKTLRLKHRAPMANLPKVKAQYGEYIRSTIVAPKGYSIVGADLSSIEDKTKQIMIYPLDPDYVNTMREKGYDAHLSLGLKANMFTQEEVDYYKFVKEGGDLEDLSAFPGVLKSTRASVARQAYLEIDKKRDIAKTVNYACLPMDTKVLTVEGWKYYDEISEGDNILSYNVEKDLVEQDVVLKKHFFDDKEVIRIKNDSDSFSSTKDHRWFGYKSSKPFGKEEIVEGFFSTDSITKSHNITLSAPYVGKNDSHISENEAALVGWLLAGSNYVWSDKEPFIYSLQIEEDIAGELESLLNLLSCGYTKITREDGSIDFSISKEWMYEFSTKVLSDRVFDKQSYNWSKWVITLSRRGLESFVEAFCKAGGLSSINLKPQDSGEIIDGIVTALQLLGEGRVSLSNQEGGKKIIRRLSRSLSCQNKVKEVLGVEDTFCLTTKNSTFIIWQNDFIGITGNCTYGAGVDKISESGGLRRKEAKLLHTGYWDINWSVEEFAKARTTKIVSGVNWVKRGPKVSDLVKVKQQKWVWNEFTRMWLFLKNDKDIFSAINQNNGVKVFDIWCYFMMKEGFNISAEFHDEWIAYIKDEEAEDVESKIIEAMEKVNKYFNPPIPIECDFQVGYKYSEIH